MKIIKNETMAITNNVVKEDEDRYLFFLFLSEARSRLPLLLLVDGDEDAATTFPRWLRSEAFAAVRLCWSIIRSGKKIVKSTFPSFGQNLSLSERSK